MKPQEFIQLMKKYGEEIAQIRQSAHALHAEVNQTYDNVLPYGHHLDMVADAVKEYGYAVCECEEDVVPLFFGAYYHDSIEDARLTYNNVKAIAGQWMNASQALMAAEMVYALTNEKGRTRAERANDKYYQGIRETPYAPFLKLSDRLANISYSCSTSSESGRCSCMKDVYSSEWQHFIESIKSDQNDIRYNLPKEMISRIEEMIG